MAKVISIVNIKGGVGKTVTAVNLAYCLGCAGKRVLALDLDAQSNLTEYFLPTDLRENFDASYKTIEAVMLPGQNGKYLPLRDCIYQSPYPRIDMVACAFGFSDANERIMVDLKRNREFRLKQALGEVEDSYDYIIIDCPPQLGTVTINAMLASSGLIIPIKVDRFAIDGLNRVFEAVQNLETGYFNKLEDVGILFTMYEKTRVITDLVAKLNAEFGQTQCYQTLVRKSTSVVEATFYTQPVVEYAPSATTAKDYIELTQEVMKRYG